MFWPSALFPFAKIDFQESGRAAERWVTPGSRLFVAGFGHTRDKINIAKVMGHAIKRLPAHAPRFRPFTRHASLPLIRISRFIGPVSGINDFVRGTPQFDESVGQKRFAIDPDTGLVSVKHY